LNVSVLIPAFNEENKIKATINTVFKLEFVNQVIVIEDGSTDFTYQQAKQTKAQIIQLPFKDNHLLRKHRLVHLNTDDLTGVWLQVGNRKVFHRGIQTVILILRRLKLTCSTCAPLRSRLWHMQHASRSR
jgi:glycosyltransferase involved in cell wall biosynthesis